VEFVEYTEIYFIESETSLTNLADDNLFFISCYAEKYTKSILVCYYLVSHFSSKVYNMIRQYHTDVNGWTSIKNNKDHIKLRNIINQYAEELPSRFDASVDTVSFHVGSGSWVIIYFNVINEKKSKTQVEWGLNIYFVCGILKKNWIWKVIC